MKNLASERVRVGMSQADLASELDIARESVARWEIGASCPSVQMLMKMSDLFGCSVDYLLGRSQERVIR